MGAPPNHRASVLIQNTVMMMIPELHLVRMEHPSAECHRPMLPEMILYGNDNCVGHIWLWLWLHMMGMALAMTIVLMTMAMMVNNALVGCCDDPSRSW